MNNYLKTTGVLFLLSCTGTDKEAQQEELCIGSNVVLVNGECVPRDQSDTGQVPPQDTDITPDPDTAPDPDPDTGTDPDTDTDTDTDSGTDTDPVECTLDDLEFSVAAHDNTGPCTSCDVNSEISLFATIHNTCSESVSFTTSSGCFVSSATLFGVMNDSDLTPMCVQAETTHMVPGEGSIEEEIYVGWVGSGGWGYEVVFGAPLNKTIESSFAAY